MAMCTRLYTLFFSVFVEHLSGLDSLGLELHLEIVISPVEKVIIQLALRVGSHGRNLTVCQEISDMSTHKTTL